MDICSLPPVPQSDFVGLWDGKLYALSQKSDGQQERWRVYYSENPAKMWIRFFCLEAAPQQGWKLHISASTSSALTVLQLVLPVLLNASSPFKVIRSSEALAELNQGVHGWSQIGKFLTLYPQSESEALNLARLLDEATSELSASAPKVLSDRPLRPGSLVHYRYGTFGGNRSLQTANGSIEAALQTPDGELVSDKRSHFYTAPSWCHDPFVAAGLAADLPSRGHIIAGRYLVANLVAASPTHMVYLAADLREDRTCMLKTPGLAWEYSVATSEVRQSLRYEASLLQLLAPVSQIPDFYVCLEEDGTTTLVMEDLLGETLADTITRLREKGQYLTFQQTIYWAKQLAVILKTIHQYGLVYADLNSSNVLVDPNERLHLVDFELTGPSGSQGRAGQGTRGYLSPQRQGGLPLALADDIYSFGSLLYFLVTAVEPSAAPNPSNLLERPLEWFFRQNTSLKALLTRCLHQLPEERYSSMDEVIAALDALEREPQGALSFREIPVHLQERDYSRMRQGYRTLSKELCETLCSLAQPVPGQRRSFWKSTHSLSYDVSARDINTGNAGVVLALAELVAAYPTEQATSLLGEAARWLCDAPLMHGQPLPGLYIGEAGVGAALLRAGQALGDEQLIRAAGTRGRLVAGLPYASPDLFIGTAGRLRFHLLLWDETGEIEHLQDAIACGEHLLRSAIVPNEKEVCWSIPDGFQRLSGQIFLGYAHGAAGIADALLDLFDVTGDPRYLTAIQGAARWLKRQAVIASGDKHMLNWPKRAQETVTPPFWCHGGAGIGRFFLHLAQQGLFPGADIIAAQAARSVALGTRWAGPTQCHGLAGNIEFLLDMYQATRQSYYATTLSLLAQCLCTFALTQDGLRVFSSESPTIFTPDYMVGYAGIALCLLRLSVPEQMPHQLSRQGFRYRYNRQWEDSAISRADEPDH